MFTKAVKNFFGDTDPCPDCGWFFACDKCSERFDRVDEDIDRCARASESDSPCTKSTK